MNRWFEVTAERFDWIFHPMRMKSFKKGQIAFEPAACVQAGLAANAIKIIKKPANAKVGKDGRIIYD